MEAHVVLLSLLSQVLPAQGHFALFILHVFGMIKYERWFLAHLYLCKLIL